MKKYLIITIILFVLATSFNDNFRIIFGHLIVMRAVVLYSKHSAKCFNENVAVLEILISRQFLSLSLSLRL